MLYGRSRDVSAVAGSEEVIWSLIRRENWAGEMA